MTLARLDAVAFTHRSALLVGAAAPLVCAPLVGPPPDLVVAGAGLLLVVAGAGLRLASVRWLGKRARVSRAKATELVARGPYAHLRNPLYAAALLIIGGLGLMAGLGAWALFPTAWAFLVYDRAVRHEERILLGTHGEAAITFMQKVPRWLPRVIGADGPDLERETWGQVARREWRLLLFMPLALVALGVLAVVGEPVRTFAATLSRTLATPLPVLVGTIAVVAAVGNALKTTYDLARKARRNAPEAGLDAGCLVGAAPDVAES